METRGRALFNLIRMNWQEDPSLPAEDWQVEDYHNLSTENLFQRLELLGLNLDEERFLQFSEAVISPEELIDTLWTSEDMAAFDQAYLLIFELWRRSLPEKQSLSIFCDHLDDLIDLYDQGEIEDEKTMQNAIADLEQVLDEHVDQGGEPKEIFKEISLYCAHDLESFIYDFISDQIDANNSVYATELLEAFEPYTDDEKWFSFLHMRLTASSDQEEANALLTDLLAEQEQEPEFEFLLDVARFLIHQGTISYFMETMALTRYLIETEQDFQELLAIASQFYRLLDKEEKADRIFKILSRRQKNPLEQEISSSDKDVKEFFALVEDLDRSEA
ncbi:MAG: hypothetical protein P0S96_00250 [Simkaniaceae bacterium]|nr:hypothetical protein [Candidatus Sacchlamyda saccharinae]